jgi:hypothetical protein
MRSAVVIPTVLVMTLLISILIGLFLSNSSMFLSNEFYKDLAEVRGYWGAYGAKELNLSNLSYSYQNYNIDINRIGGNEWEWHLKIPSGKGSGIQDSDLYIKSIVVESDSSNRTKSYY